MEDLPNEILQSIFSQLSQKYITTQCSIVCKKWNKLVFQPSFYSTIHIYSTHQLKKFTQVATTKIINKRYIGHYVKGLNFHFMGSLLNMLKHEEGLKHFATVFPNLQTIYGLLNNDVDKDASIYLYLKQINNFLYCYPFQPWITIFNDKKDILKSLEINITQQLFHLNSQSDNIIHLQLTNDTMKKNGVVNAITEEDIPTKILILPTLINLTKLKIDFCTHANRLLFCFHNIDERTMENIHQSCPKLESLTLNDFIMSISDQYYYYNNSNNKRILPAICLKHININGDLTDPLCYTYLSIKYTHLESLSLYISENTSITNGNSSHFEKFSQSIYQMINGFSLLKSINCQTFHHIGPNSYQNNIRNGSYIYWPHLLFIDWLNQNPNQLIHLNYPFDLTENDFSATTTHNINKQLQYQHTYLNYLTSLSLRTDNAIHLVLNYLLQNIGNSSLPIVSTNLKELTISSSYSISNNNGLFIYDWLTIFPNLISFKLNHMLYIYDDDDESNINNDKNNHFKDINHDNQESVALHQLIKQQYNTLNRKKNAFYKLGNLEISESHIYFNNNDGFDFFLRNCQQLKGLVLKNNKIYISAENKTSASVATLPLSLSSSLSKEKSLTSNQFHFDLSNLYLELLYIKNLLLILGNNFVDKNYVNKLIIYESVSDNKRIIEGSNDFYTIETIKNGSPYRSCALFLECKFNDGLVFNP
ncbi:unnamed protein product [Cunninghamella blakesleeana]